MSDSHAFNSPAKRALLELFVPSVDAATAPPATAHEAMSHVRPARASVCRHRSADCGSYRLNPQATVYNIHVSIRLSRPVSLPVLPQAGRPHWCSATRPCVRPCRAGWRAVPVATAGRPGRRCHRGRHAKWIGRRTRTLGQAAVRPDPGAAVSAGVVPHRAGRCVAGAGHASHCHRQVGRWGSWSMN